MEGLLIAEELGRLAGQLPASRGNWRFPDPFTFVLPLGRGALWLFLRPPHPRLAYLREALPVGNPGTPFQEMVAARVVGALEAIRQHKLDRLVILEFSAEEGFVPHPPVKLVAELTGRNCNLVLLDREDRILGSAREVGREQNRFRQLRPGLTYQPPPPYDKLDPRTASPAELKEALRGRSLKVARSRLDGIGPQLTRAWSLVADLDPEETLEGERLDRALAGLASLLERPSEVLREVLGQPDVVTLHEQEARTVLQQRLRSVLEKRRDLLLRKLDDLDQLRRAAEEAPGLREKADLLLAFQHRVPAKSTATVLTGFNGRPVTIDLDPRLDAVRNAEQLYRRARKREARAAAIPGREAELQAEVEQVERQLDQLPDLPQAELEATASELLPRRTQPRAEGPGVRYRDPLGYTVLVGRSAAENDEITFRRARSRDVWLHVQGYQGAHVVIQSQNREVPFDTILFAAQLAAAYSRAASGDNVAVDYTLRKHVWKVKGAPLGTAHFAHHKTVYVTPSRRPGSEGASADG